MWTWWTKRSCNGLYAKMFVEKRVDNGIGHVMEWPGSYVVERMRAQGIT